MTDTSFKDGILEIKVTEDFYLVTEDTLEEWGLEKIELKEGEYYLIQFKDTITDELRIPYIYKPDVLVKQTKEDFLNKKDTVLDFSLSYSKGEKV